MTSNPPRRFLGWQMIGLGSACYGLAISPMYYCWGFFLPEMQADLGMNDTQGGLIFSVFSWIYHLLGPVAGFAIGRWGIRSMMSLGAVVGVVAFWLMSRVESFADAMFAYAVLGGIAIGFGTILAAQALASNWFIRYRSRAMALILGGGAVVGYLTLRYFAPGILEVADWRTGWLIIAGISALVAILAALFMRGEPERIGQEPDGGVQAKVPESDGPSGPTGRGEWTAPLALRTSQFYVLVGLSIAYGVPWGIIAVFGRHHLDALGFTTAAAGSILGARVLVSLFGRLSAFAGDFMTPQRLLGIVLILEGAGCALFIAANTELMAYLSMLLIGLGFGAAYVCIPVVYSAFYGRRAFATTVGIRFAITGVISPAAPTVAGMLSDWSGSHVLTLSILSGLCLVGSLVAFGLRAPLLGARPITPPATG
ncbi:MAG: MFS transporter [Holophagales bacterium]|nr:MFS transporter [Holophagales bacterium]MYG29296.1 MFS transporter [Holophagales bacterium]MYI81134.1 MFS transporter [Holophagales bacterium]